MADPSWVWYDVVSPPLQALLQGQPRYRCSEHVLRFSAELLDALDAFARRGLAAWSELVPTLCAVARLRWGELQERHLGSVYRFDGKAGHETDTERLEVNTKRSRKGMKRARSAVKWLW